jgi:hypothetical protein
MVEELRPHQKAALRQLSNGKILWGATGTGKSRVAAAYYELEERHKNVYVVTTAKKRDSSDWEKEFAHIVVGKKADTTLHGVLTVDSWNNIDKYKDVKGAFFIFDEQRLVGNGLWVKSFIKIAKNNNWILLSATPGDSWMDYIPVFVGNGFYKNRTEFIREHVNYAPYVRFPKVQSYQGVGRLVKYRNQILVHMPFEKQTVRHSKTIQVGYDENLMDLVTKNRWNPFKEEPIRDITDMLSVMRKVANTDPSRLKALRKLLKAHDKLILFYNFNYELDILRSLESVVPIAEWNGHKHEEIPETDKWLYLVQYVAGSEGWNCIDSDATAFWSLTYSYKNWEQAHGRIDRMNTEFIDLWYYTFRSNSQIDNMIWGALKAKKNFQPAKFDFKDMIVGLKADERIV